MKKLKVGDLVKGTECNADILKAVVTREPWEEIETEWVGLKIIDSTNPGAVGKTLTVCTSYVEKISADDNFSGESKFVVGDHIKGNSNTYVITNKKLIDAEVIAVHANSIDIKCIRFLDEMTTYIGYVATFVDPDAFDYADGYSPVSRLVSSYMINGKEYTDEQYVKDCERFGKAFPHDKTIEIQHAIENVLIVYQWAQEHPVVTNLDHYAEEFGWKEEQKEFMLKSICPFPFMGKEYKLCPKQSSGNTVLCGECRKWWNQEWKGGKA